MLLINQILVMTSLSNLLNLGNLIGPRKIRFGLDSISNPNQTPFKPQIEAHLVGPTRPTKLATLAKLLGEVSSPTWQTIHCHWLHPIVP